MAVRRADEPDLSHDLVRRIQAGDTQAWDALYLRYRDALLFSIRARLGDKLRARVASEDILHSVVREAMSDLLEFEPRGEHALRHYLHVCVLNKIRSKAAFFAAEKRRGEVPLSDSVLQRVPGGAGLDYLESDKFAKLERAMRLLPDNMREVLILRRVEGLDNPAAAKAMQKSEEATAKLHTRAMARLSLLMLEDFGEGCA